MKFDIVQRGDALSMQLTDQFRNIATQLGLTHDTEQPNVVVSIGGDGTLLHAFHKFLHRLEETTFVGVHTGHLGFFADWKPEEIKELAQQMAESGANLEQRIVQYPIVEVQVETKSATKTYYALNEFTLKAHQSMLVAQIDINDQKFEMFRGDGICVSTPMGSTAYNKSLGGAIIHPALESIQLAEMSSINNRVYRTLGSPIILPKHHHCDIYPISGTSFIVSIDHLQYEVEHLQEVRCMVAERKVRFARFRPFPFWTRVREAFIGNGKQ